MSERDYASVEVEVFDEVRRVLNLESDAPLHPAQLVFEDLGLDSLDLVELIYRLERRFSISIEPGTLVRLARGDIAETDFFDDVFLSALGRARVRELLHDTPPERFPAEIHRSTIPLYATIGALARVVHRLLAAR